MVRRGRGRSAAGATEHFLAPRRTRGRKSGAKRYRRPGRDALIGLGRGRGRRGRCPAREFEKIVEMISDLTGRAAERTKGSARSRTIACGVAKWQGFPVVAKGGRRGRLLAVPGAAAGARAAAAGRRYPKGRGATRCASWASGTGGDGIGPAASIRSRTWSTTAGDRHLGEDERVTLTRHGWDDSVAISALARNSFQWENDLTGCGFYARARARAGRQAGSEGDPQDSGHATLGIKEIRRVRGH